VVRSEAEVKALCLGGVQWSKEGGHGSSRGNSKQSFASLLACRNVGKQSRPSNLHAYLAPQAAALHARCKLRHTKPPSNSRLLLQQQLLLLQLAPTLA